VVEGENKEFTLLHLTIEPAIQTLTTIYDRFNKTVLKLCRHSKVDKKSTYTQMKKRVCYLIGVCLHILNNEQISMKGDEKIL
jgi:hypothetical protein